jgi:hypothetical protein
VQVHTVLDEKNQILEETRFMLPVGAAVNIKHLRPMYERLGPLSGTTSRM